MLYWLLGPSVEELDRFAKTTGASNFKVFIKIGIYSALPHCFVEFKYAAINATVGATITEFLGSYQGLRFYILIVTGNMCPDLAFAGIFLLTIIGALALWNRNFCREDTYPLAYFSETLKKFYLHFVLR